MKSFIGLLTVLCCLNTSSFACSEVGNRPYVEAVEGGGAFYARCIPADFAGIAGTTTIYRVNGIADEKLDAYDWYSRHGVKLGWSPSVKKMAVMRLRAGKEPKDGKVEFSFYLGGEFLRSYTTQELIDLGVEYPYVITSCGPRLNYKVLEANHILDTDYYAFSIEFETSKEGQKIKRTLYFDILTGKLVSP